MNNLVALVVGVLFGAGLAVSGMTDTEKVLGFLDLFGAWDASLLFVMGAGLLITVPVFQVYKKRTNTLLGKRFILPVSAEIDASLITGAALFGLGWGLYGYCPGPAISSLSYGSMDSIYFLIAMLCGMGFVSLLQSPKK